MRSAGRSDCPARKSQHVLSLLLPQVDTCYNWCLYKQWVFLYTFIQLKKQVV